MKKKTPRFNVILGLLIIVFILFCLFYFLIYNNSEDILTEKEVKWLESQENLIYAADKNAPPLRFLDEVDGQYKGVLIDYINTLSIEMGINIELYPMLWEDALISLSEGKTNLCDMFISEKRGKSYQFSKPIYNLRGVLAIRKDVKGIRSLDDLDGMSMAMQKGDYASEYLELHYPNIKQILVKDLEEALFKVSEGQAVATMGDEPVISFNIDKNKLSNSVTIVEDPVYENQVAFAVPKSMPELIPILNKCIDSINRKNLLEKIQQKWFGISTPIVKTIDMDTIKKYVVFSSSIVLVIILLMTVWNKSLQSLIKSRTKELEQSKNDLQIVFDSMLEYMIVLDDNKNILDANRSLLDSICQTKEDIFKKNYKIALNLFSQTNIDDLVDRVLNEQENILEEKQLGNYIYEIRLYPLIDIANKEIKVLVLLYNITNEKINTSNLLHANKMMAIGELAAGIAHEIRNPLGIIRNHSFMINSIAEKDEAIKESIKYIDSAVIRANYIIENLLRFSSISRNEIENVNLYDFINNILEIQKNFMKKKNITYIIDCDKEYYENINQESLKHVFINLINNSIDAIETEGVITVRAFTEVGNLIVEFIDTGKGIMEKDINKVFNPFYTTKELGKGTGLGLYIVYNEVKKLNGSIYVSSKINTGTRFKLVLPIEHVK